MMNKKGAIEFSMTTIMVIIIGVAVLALGLTWIRGTFTQVGTLTETSLENAETILGEVGFTGKVGVPATIVLDTNDAKKFKVLVRNTMATGDSFALDVVSDGTDCIDAGAITTEAVYIEDGEVGELIGGVTSSDCDHDVSSFLTVTVSAEESNTPGHYGAEGIVVQVS